MKAFLDVSRPQMSKATLKRAKKEALVFNFDLYVDGRLPHGLSLPSLIQIDNPTVKASDILFNNFYLLDDPELFLVARVGRDILVLSELLKLNRDFIFVGDLRFYHFLESVGFEVTSFAAVNKIHREYSSLLKSAFAHGHTPEDLVEFFIEMRYLPEEYPLLSLSLYHSSRNGFGSKAILWYANLRYLFEKLDV